MTRSPTNICPECGEPVAEHTRDDLRACKRQPETRESER